jgi:hypothetical protein
LHNIPKENKKNILSFLLNPFYSVETNNDIYSNLNFMNQEKIIINDLNYMTGQKYKNIFELRKLKNWYLTNIIPHKVKNYILINYEDLLYNYDDVLTLIKNRFSLTPRFETFKKIIKYKKSGSYNFVQQRTLLLYPIIIELIWDNLDIKQETYLGYEKNVYNKYFIRNDINLNLS